MGKKKRHFTPDYSQAKISAVMILFALILAALWLRAGQVQLLQGGRLNALASRQNLAAEFERGERGRIIERNGHLLATSVEAKSVYVRPLEVEDEHRTAAVLGKLLGLSPKAVLKDFGAKRNFVWIKRQIRDAEAAEVAKADLPGVYLTSEYTRMYPNGRLAGQVLGFVDVDGHGLEGIERAFDSRLAERQAQFVVQRDASGRRLYLDAQGREVDINGLPVRLTIDARIQDAAEQALAEAVKKHEAKAGVALVVTVANGEVLALANYPFFNPNQSRQTPPELRRDRASLDLWEPGSTLKPFLFAAALEEKVVTPDKLVDCEAGKFRVADRIIRDTHPYRWLEVRDVLKYSSNIGSAKIGQALGAGNYHGYLSRLGFGGLPGLEVLSESPGMLRPAREWSELDLSVISFGQGIGVTALQMAKAYLCLANKGVLKSLRLVLDPVGEDKEPARVFSQATVEEVLSMMRSVVEGDGTGKKARIAGISMAGKTGTAQKPSKTGGYGQEHMASFVGLLPGEAPELLVLVVVDEPKGSIYGGDVAAPVVRDIALRTLAYWGRLPDPGGAVKLAGKAAGASEPGPHVLAASSRPPIEVGASVPDMRGLPLRRALEVLVKKGIVPVLKGQGMAVAAQRPAPGEPWPEGKPEAKGEGKDDVFVLWLS